MVLLGIESKGYFSRIKYIYEYGRKVGNSTELDGVRSPFLASFIIIETKVLSTFSDL
jgi:hypothetical protein